MFPHPPLKSKDSISEASDLQQNRLHLHHKEESLKQISHVQETENSRTCRKSKDISAARMPLFTFNSSNSVRTGCVEKKDSFSKYQPLPSINNNPKNNMNKAKDSNKRSLIIGGRQLSASADVSNGTVDDIIVSASMKRMKLSNSGMAYLSKSMNHSSNAANEQVDLLRKFKKSDLKDENNDCLLLPHSVTPINLIIRLPDGKRLQNSFNSDDLLKDLFKFVSQKVGDEIRFENCAIYTNEVPKKELTNIGASLSALGIKDRTVLTIDTRN